MIGSRLEILKPRIIITASFILLLGVAYWGGKTSTQQATRTVDSTTLSAPALWTVKPFTLGQSLDFEGSIEQPVAEGPLANRSGVVTGETQFDNGPLNEGEPVLEIDGRKTLAAQGNIPAYRDLSLGLEGADVKQLVEFLCRHEGLNACYSPTVFSERLEISVRKWQTDVGFAPDGVVQRGDLMWFSTLPQNLSSNQEFKVGSLISETDRPVSQADGEPYVAVSMTDSQRNLIPDGAAVTSEDGISGVIGERRTGDANSDDNDVDPSVAGGQDELGQLDQYDVLDPDSQAPICTVNESCKSVLNGSTKAVISFSVDTVPEQSGLAVPTMAVQTGADGSSYVLSEKKTRLPVVVGASGRGMSLVDGIADGTKVRVG